MSIDASAVARAVGIDTKYRDLRAGAALFLAQHIAIIGQGSDGVDYPLEPWDATSAQAAGARYGYGSPIHLAVRELFPIEGGGVAPIRVTVLPLGQNDANKAQGTITPSGSATVNATYWARVAGVLSAPISVSAGDNQAAIAAKIVAAVNAILAMPATAADTVNEGVSSATLTAKWVGESGNDLTVEMLDATGQAPASGLTFTIVQPTGGTGDPSVATALAMLGTDWVTMVINAFGPTNTTALGLIAAKGEARWDQLVRRPFVAFTGNPEPVLATATATTGARPTDRVNVQLVSPGAVELPVQIAAAQVREIAKLANNNPPTDYGGLAVRTLLPGPDNLQWDYASRDLAIKAGSSTVEVRDGIVRLSDTVTMYHPSGETPPAYRHVVDIVKLQNIIYNFDLEFGKPEWNGAPLIADGQPTVNPNARTPSAAKARACSILDGLGAQAIITDVEASKKATTATISPQNPKRLDLSTVVRLSGNSNITSIDLNFGFFFGQAAAA